MNQLPVTSDKKKEVIALSMAAYRGIEILETKDGCTFFLGKMQYDCIDLGEAKAAIDAIYVNAARRVIN